MACNGDRGAGAGGDCDTRSKGGEAGDDDSWPTNRDDEIARNPRRFIPSIAFGFFAIAAFVSHTGSVFARLRFRLRGSVRSVSVIKKSTTRAIFTRTGRRRPLMGAIPSITICILRASTASQIGSRFH